MVDDFIVCVDQIITTACIKSVSSEVSNLNRREKGENLSVKCSALEGENGEGSSKKPKKREMIECRICQEEDDERSMEAPCGCNGTLKFAHRRCIQRWCNKKGDIICEICNQVYAPNYSLPPARSSPDVLDIDIRQSWSSQLDLQDPHFLALAAEHRSLQVDYEDYDSINTSGVAWCRAVALTLMLLLLLPHTLLVTKDSRLVQDAIVFFNVSMLQLLGFLLPCYMIARALCILQSRRQRQGLIS